MEELLRFLDRPGPAVKLVLAGGDSGTHRQRSSGLAFGGARANPELPKQPGPVHTGPAFVYPFGGALVIDFIHSVPAAGRLVVVPDAALAVPRAPADEPMRSW